ASAAGTVTAAASSIAHVRPASLQCFKLVSVNGGALVQSVTLSNVVVGNIVWYVTVTNTGQADLTNLTITDFNPGDLPCNLNLVWPGLLPTGSSTPLIALCTNSGFVNCVNTNFDNWVKVVASVADELTNC